MTDPDSGATRRDLAHAAERTSDAGAALLGSLTETVRSVRAAHAAKHPLRVIGRELRQGRVQARERRALALLRPSALLRQHSAEVLTAAAASGLTDVLLFGSCVRGTDTPASDVDLLVAGGARTSLLTISRFAIDVADALGLPEDRVDVVTAGGLVPGSRLERQIVAEAQPLAAWAAGWPRLDSVPAWAAARAVDATEEELVEAAESGLHPWGETATTLRIRPEGRPAGATLVDLGEVERVGLLLVRYVAGIADGLDHDAALTRAVTAPRPA